MEDRDLSRSHVVATEGAQTDGAQTEGQSKADLFPSQFPPPVPRRRRLVTKLVISELLTHSTLAGAAEALGVDRTTLWRFMKRPDFRSAFDRACSETFQNASSQLQHVASLGVDKLAELMSDWSISPWARICAATTAVKLALQSLALRSAREKASDGE